MTFDNKKSKMQNEISGIDIKKCGVKIRMESLEIQDSARTEYYRG